MKHGFLVGILICILLLMFLLTANAQETTLTTTVPSSHILHLDIDGKGTVTVNGIEYSKSKDIPIQRHSEPSVQIRPARGYSIGSVTCNQENITHLVNSGEWAMPKVESDVILSVVFEKDCDDQPTDNNTNYYLMFIKHILSIIRKYFPW